jgi:hypothetical protein
MAERSLAREVEDLRLGDGDIFRGEGILAITSCNRAAPMSAAARARRSRI